ncbi:polyisoprenoid-binding protein YceI [Pedobacter cryoconitis]|uniref:Polyisoprenoid-binding protein YceI n=1 Tax=Pedobacter cryoconitis TaxID=188932 RepID=A0A7W8ZNI5_9SPHI|nr:YceI family protein [Pedobacter cryoconitis]MBB5637052.1 polyisoprenoid-binding protein YceI [Pedobacter cryoconitis]
MENQKFIIDTAQSNIDWVGKKVTGAHNGTIAIKAGNIIFNDDKIIGGDFIIDTTSINILDITDPDTNAQFLGHLISDDFFGAEQFQEANLVINTVTGNRIDADLTIKGITHPINFDAELQLKDNTVSATAKLLVDRTKYGMKFRSGNFFLNLGDTLIYNDFELNISITAKAESSY